MNKKSILPELNASSIVYLIGALSLLLCIPACFYGPLDLTNSFYVAACSLSAQTFLRAVVFDFKDKKDSEQKKALILGPINLVTGILILLFALPSPIPSNVFLIILVTVISGMFLNFGFRDSIVGLLYLRLQRKEGREFREEMKQVAETARMEEALVADLAESLAEFGPTDTESSEN